MEMCTVETHRLFFVVVFYLGLILLHGKAFLFSLDSVDQKDLCDQICGIAT